ncbi:MAG: aldehyde ferredoxin oxidoreductase C-terminal domain-containing protein, partial [Candidatus Bathyarchaeota archaeon]
LLQFPRAAEALELTTGIKLTEQEVRDVGSRITTIERMFGVREGIGRKDDTVPKRFTDTPLMEGGSSGSVMDIELMLDEYYTERGWSLESGHPTPEALRALDLDHAVKDIP